MSEIEKFDPVATLEEMLGEQPTPRAKEIVAGRLSRLAGKPEARGFTTSYLDNVIAGRMEVGAPLERALRAVFIESRGGRPVIGALEPVTIYARPGQLEEAAIAPNVRSERCARLACSQPFVVNAPNHKFCCVECQEKGVEG